MNFPPLILASTSRYRRELLARLGRPFHVENPSVDESAQPGESPPRRAARLARAKAQAIAQRHPDALVIGSDQVCALGERVLDKAGSRLGQIEQLAALSRHAAAFHTAVCLVRSKDGFLFEHVDLTRCVFRNLSRAAIADYAEREPALDCAGGFKIEGLGITLIERVEAFDPTALVGLPLIAVSSGLEAFAQHLQNSSASAPTH